MAKQKKEIDTEINLVSFISLLSVLICSLLLTAIWIQIGSVNVKQAVGGQSADDKKEKPPTLWVKFDKHNQLSLELNDGPKVARKLARVSFAAIDGKVDTLRLKEYISEASAMMPNWQATLIKPIGETVYEDIIAVMDQFKEAGINDLGVAPL